MSEHTPIPWSVDDFGDQIAVVSGDRIIACMGFKEALDEANFAFIVKAVNNHKRLVEFVKEISYNRCHCGTTKARALLAKIDEGSE